MLFLMLLLLFLLHLRLLLIIAQREPNIIQFCFLKLAQLWFCTSQLTLLCQNLMYLVRACFNGQYIQKQHKKVKFVPENRNSTLLYVLYIISKRIFDFKKIMQQTWNQSGNSLLVFGHTNAALSVVYNFDSFTSKIPFIYGH